MPESPADPRTAPMLNIRHRGTDRLPWIADTRGSGEKRHCKETAVRTGRTTFFPFRGHEYRYLFLAFGGPLKRRGHTDHKGSAAANHPSLKLGFRLNLTGQFPTAASDCSTKRTSFGISPDVLALRKALQLSVLTSCALAAGTAHSPLAPSPCSARHAWPGLNALCHKSATAHAAPADAAVAVATPRRRPCATGRPR